MSNFVLDVIKLTQPIGEFYISKMDAHELFKLSYTDVRKLNDQKDYWGVQRELDKTKISSIKRYIEYSKATFPNSIILNIKKEKILSNDGMKLEIIGESDTFSIIDGQHRLSGFDGYNGKFDLAITIFIDLDIEAQEDIFVTINTEQTKVNSSLALDLKSSGKEKTPERVARDIAFAFNKDEKSPFYKSIAILGRKDEISSDKMLTLASFALPIISRIYNDKYYYSLKDALESYRIEHSLIELQEIKDTIDFEKYESNRKKYYFWDLYISDEEKTIYKILSNFFEVIKTVLPEDWGSSDSILTKTTGYNALIKLFDDLFRIGYDSKQLSFDFFYGKLKNLSSLTGMITSNIYGGSGDAASQNLYNHMKRMISK